jgi:hypothetical protein
VPRTRRRGTKREVRWFVIPSYGAHGCASSDMTAATSPVRSMRRLSSRLRSLISCISRDTRIARAQDGSEATTKNSWGLPVLPLIGLRDVSAGASAGTRQWQVSSAVSQDLGPLPWRRGPGERCWVTGGGRSTMAIGTAHVTAGSQWRSAKRCVRSASDGAGLQVASGGRRQRVMWNRPGFERAFCAPCVIADPGEGVRARREQPVGLGFCMTREVGVCLAALDQLA